MSGVHFPGAGHQHEFEPVHGLPEVPPPDEHILWQGAPDWRALAIRAFHLRKIALYFAVLLALRSGVALRDGGSAADALYAAVQLMPLAALGLGLLAVLAWLSARTTAYTLTNRRVVMRVGIVLTMTFNLPYKRIAAADLAAGPRGTGDIALRLAGRDRIAWLQLWPHARPWRLARPEPSLRCIDDAATVAQLLGRQWSAATGLDAQPLDAPAPAGTDGGRGRAMPGRALGAH